MITELLERYPALRVCETEINQAAQTLIRCFEEGGKLLVCGNGGSAADSEHIVGELMKGFRKRRPLNAEQRRLLKTGCPEICDDLVDSLQGALPAVALTGWISLSTAFSNDVRPEYAYAQQVWGLGRPGDVLMALSTSGNSANVLHACKVAKGLGMTVIALTGAGGGKMRAQADITIAVPETQTHRVQELHLPVYHALCAAAEDRFFAE